MGEVSLEGNLIHTRDEDLNLNTHNLPGEYLVGDMLIGERGDGGGEGALYSVIVLFSI